MPTRMLREGILDSEPVNALSWEAEVFYRRLMSVVDDFGRFDGRASILRGRLYAAKLDKVREADIPRWIAECVKAGLLALYTVDGKPYILFHKLGPPRAKVSKFPPPPPGVAQPDQPTKAVPTSVNVCIQTHTDANGCMQTRADVPYSISDSGPYSGSGSGPTPGAGGPAGASVGRSAQPPPDPLVAEQALCREFAAAWDAAGLKPIGRLTHGLRARLVGLAADPWWGENWRPAVARCGQIPFFRDGVERRQGRLDPIEFLSGDDFVRQVLDGRYDPRPPAVPATAKPPTPRGVGGMTNDEIRARMDAGSKPPGG